MSVSCLISERCFPQFKQLYNFLCEKFALYLSSSYFCITKITVAQELIKKKDTKREHKNILRKYLEVWKKELPLQSLK